MSPWRAWFLLLVTVPLHASPVAIGKAQLDAALSARGLNHRIKAELGELPADSFQIELTIIRGGDLRGLMYGLLEAADQIRATGKLRPMTSEPARPIRSVRMDASTEGISAEYWTTLFQLLARARINRFELTLTHMPAGRVLAPIAEVAAEYGVDFVLGLSECDYDGLKSLLSACPAIRAVSLQSASDDAARATADAGRLVSLIIRDGVAPSACDLKIEKDYDGPAILKWGRRNYGESR